MPRRIRLISAQFLATALAVAIPSIGAADTNPTPVAIPALGTQGPASVYPSTVFIQAEGGQLHPFGRASIVLHAVTHPCPEDLAILLVHNNTDKYLLLSGAGGCRPLQGTDLRFNGSAPTLPDEEPASPPHGEFLSTDPVSYGNPVFPAPAPPPPYVIGMPPIGTFVNGTWSLYIVDTRDGGRGVMAAGWSLLYDATIRRSSVQSNVALPGGGFTAGPAASYPITFDLTDARPTATVRSVSFGVTLQHQRPEDLRLVLQSPSGTAVVLMANAGGNTPIGANTTITFRDNSATTAPDAGPIGEEDYSPGGSYGVVALGPPAPPPPYATAFAAFDGESAAGTWKLWAIDGIVANTGLIDGAMIHIGIVDDMHVTVASPVPIGVVSTSPFVRVLLTTTGLDATNHVQWRVTNGPAFDFYDAGPFERIQGTGMYVADLPVKNGVNDITVLARNVSGGFNTNFFQVGVDEFTYSLAEGATGGFFDLDVTIANFGDPVAPVSLEFLQEGGAVVPLDTNVNGNGQQQLQVDEITPEASVSTVVHSTSAIPLAVERTMTWDDRGYGGHGGTSTDPATRWLFAEGSQGFFATYILLANSNAAAANATLKFLLEGGGAVNHDVVVPAKARLTVYAGDVPALANQSFGLDVTSTLPIIAERAMYMPGARLFEGGHGSAGVNRPETQWFLAEGATGPFFECFILLSNPDAADANVSLRYLLPDGTGLSRAVVVPANGRLTINVETVDPLLANTPVSTVVFADRGIIVERAMYWPDLTQGWQEAHNSFGLTDTALRWGVADGRVGGPRGYETYVLLANPNGTPAEVLVRFLRADGSVLQQEYTLAPTSRLNVQASLVPGLGEGVFSAEVRVLNYQPIAVEKAMYWNAEGAIWAGGTNVTATRLPPP